VRGDVERGGGNHTPSIHGIPLARSLRQCPLKN
jgi:hypothetical protein